MRASKNLSLSLSILLATGSVLIATSGRAQPLPPAFSWGNVTSHPLAVTGGELEGLPDGDYLTPSEDQGARCAGGCVLYATAGAMEMQYKIQLREPQVTLDLSEDHLLDLHDVQNRGTGSGTFCGSDCNPLGISVVSCVPGELIEHGLLREQTRDDPDYNNIEYRIAASNGYELFDAGTDFDAIKQRLLRSPIVGSIQVDATTEGAKYLWCNTAGVGGPVDQIYHRVVFVGFRSVPYTPPTGGTAYHHALQIKNSWGTNGLGYSSYDWLPWDSECLYKSDWLQVKQVVVNEPTQDRDNDGVADHRDLCPGVFSGRQNGQYQPNLDNDAWGDECDPDIDDDHVLDGFDCDPHNRFLAYDLDRDGVCDDAQRAVNAQGQPFSSDAANISSPLYPPALDDYKRFHVDGTTDESVNHWRAIADGDSSPNVDLDPDVVCQHECDRVAAMPAAVRPDHFALTACRDRCDHTVVARDTCSPYMVGRDPQRVPSVYDSCLRLHGCVTRANDEVPCDLSASDADLWRCRHFWHNPGLGQQDTDSDGTGDFCDQELYVTHFAISVDTEPYRLPGGLGLTTNAMRCYDDEYQISFDTWGGRAASGAEGGTRRPTGVVAACYCPQPTWNTTCETYCPSQGEFATAADATRNPGASNHAWDPISSPLDCMSKRDIDAGLDHHFCIDRSFNFLGYNYDGGQSEDFAWRWRPFYDPDQPVGTTFAEHPSIQYSEANPGLVKIRVSWSADDTPAGDEKFISPQPVQMLGGCFSLLQQFEERLDISPDWLLSPSDLFELPHLLPNDLVSQLDFGNVARPGAAVAMAGDHVLAIDPVDGSLLAAAPVRYLGAARLAAASAGRPAAALGVMDSGLLTMVSGSSGVLTPVVFLHDGSQLWLGLLAFANTWVPWSDAFAGAAPAVHKVAGLAATSEGSMLLVGLDATSQSWTAYELRAASWSTRAVLAPGVLDAAVTGLAVVNSGRHLVLVGGEGARWPGLVHRWDLQTNRLDRLDFSALVGWQGTRTGLGVFARDEELFVVGSAAVKLNLISGSSEVLRSEVPQALGSAPFVYFDPARGQLTLISVGTGGPALVLGADIRQPDSWIQPPATSAGAETATGARSGSYTAGDLELLLFEVTPERAGKPHRARLVAASNQLGLQLLDARGAVLAVSASTSNVSEIEFTPQADQQFYILKVVARIALEAGEQVAYQLAVEALDPGAVPAPADDGCGCAQAGAGAAGPLLLLSLLVAGQTRRRRREVSARSPRPSP